ncbi:MAG: NADH-quinone oxidoreductase subunit N [Dehalococcoidia bacterium]
MTAHDLWVLSPVMAMAGVAIFMICADLVVNNKRLLAYMGFAALAVPLFFSLNLWFGWVGDFSAGPALFDSIIADRFALFFHFLLIGVTGGVILASIRYVDQLPEFRGEFFALVLLSVTGMMLLVSARELISIYVSLELTALPVAALAAIKRDGRSVEAGLKFLVLSAVSTAVMLYGIAFIYGYTGSTHLETILARLAEIPAADGQPFGSYAVLFAIVMIIAGFGFKMAAVPWQMWVPDVYQGSPTPVAAFLSVASKASAFAVLLRVMYTAFGADSLTQDWSSLFAILAALSMLVGSLLALAQTNVKRLLGYSTIAQGGYILAGVAAVAANTETGAQGAGPQGVMYYLAGYAFTNLAVFFAIIAISNRTGSEMISGLNGMGRRSPVLAVLLTVGILSLLGVPPTVGFMSKVVVFSAAVNSGLLWLAVLGMLTTVVSAYYYLKIVRAMFFEDAEDDSPVRADPPLLFATGVAAAGVAVFGVAPWLILHLAEKALTILPSAAGA